MSLTTVFLGLGSNIERERHLLAGLEALSAFLIDLRCSPVFESQAVGIKSGPFFNLVVQELVDGRDVKISGFGNFQLRAPGALESAALAGIGALLGWIGAQLSVSLSLRRFD